MPAATHADIIAAEQLAALNRRLDGLSPRQRILWAHDVFGDGLVLSTSFGTYSAVMLHLVQQILPGVKVLFVDTGYLTPATYRFKRELTSMLELDVRTYLPARSRAEREALEGTPEEMVACDNGAERLASELKVEPLERALQDLNASAWMSGIMRRETQLREGFSVVVPRDDGLFKIHPILDWDTESCQDYLRTYGLPANRDYHDVCKPSNRECGIHLTGIDRSRSSSEL